MCALWMFGPAVTVSRHSASARLAPPRGPRGLGYRDRIRRATGFEGDRKTQLAAAILQGGERCVSPRHTALTSERTFRHVVISLITRSSTGPVLDRISDHISKMAISLLIRLALFNRFQF